MAKKFIVLTFIGRMKSWLPLVAMLLGACVPQASVLTFSIRYSVMLMLFMSFLGVRPRWELFRWGHLWLLLANVTMAVGLYGLFRLILPEYALLAFLCGIMPSAAVGPVIAGLLGRSVGFVTLALLLSNLGMALVIPFLLPLLGVEDISLSTIDLIGSVSVTVLLPMLLSQVLRISSSRAVAFLLKARNLTFWLFMLNVFLAMAKASDYLLHESQAGWLALLSILAVVVLITALNFGAGWLLESPAFRPETSLALGRKNTMFGVWLAVTFLPPLTVLGPIAYVITHNVWHSVVLGRKQGKKLKSEKIREADG